MIRHCRRIFFITLLSLAGCTTQAWYESAKVTAEQQCRDQPAGMQEACFSRLNQKSYEDYRRSRDEATGKDAPPEKTP